MRIRPVFAALLLGFAPGIRPLLADTPAAIAWPKFPVPSEVLTQPEETQYPSRVLQQTAAGLFANRARRSAAPGPYVFIDQPRRASDATWLKSWRERTQVPVRALEGGVWALVKELQARRLVAGYVLYKAPEWGNPYSTRPPSNLSANLATSLCGPLGAVAINENQQAQADALGLKMLADARALTYDALFKDYGAKLSPNLVASLDPRSPTARDMAVACDAPVVINCPGGGLPEVLRRARPGGFMFGWGLEGEDQCVRDASRAGLEVVAANWSYNLPLFASARGEIQPQQATPRPPLLSGDKPGTRYVAFIESDGDNVTWTMSDFSTARKYFAHPARGSMPYGWSLPVSNLAELGPDVWNHLVKAATPNDDYVHIGLTGYGFLDDTPPADITRQATLLNPYLQRANVHSMIAFTDKQWDSPASKAAFQNIVDHCPAVRCIMPLQYMPYAAGAGRLLWCNRDGKRIPVLPPRTDLWDDNQGDLAGPPDRIAKVLNRWAQGPVNSLEDTYAWVIVHAWTDFGNNTAGVGAAKACAAALDPNIRVVKPAELVDRLYRAANP